jgi:hypothetical protein
MVKEGMPDLGLATQNKTCGTRDSEVFPSRKWYVVLVCTTTASETLFM